MACGIIARHGGTCSGRPARTLLTRGDATSQRQQTLRNTIGWSYDLLSEKEQKAFQRLSVFAGGASGEAAEVVLSAASN